MRGLLLIASLVFVGCVLSGSPGLAPDRGHDVSTSVQAGGSASQTAPALSEVELVGRAFRSTSRTEAGYARPLVAGTSMSLVFIDSTHLGARAGCNSFGANYRLDGFMLIIRNEVETLIACARDQDSQEQWLFNLLRSSPVIVLSGHVLALGEGDRQADFLEANGSPQVQGLLGMAGPARIIASLD